MTQAEISSLTKSRWGVLIASCLINLCIGSMYAWSALSAPMADALGEAPQNLAIVFSISNAVGFIAMIIGGLLNDKFGPRWVMFTGGVMFGLGMFLCGYAQSVTHLILSYGLCLGLGLALVYGCTISNTIKFFPDKRGLVGGMTTAFYGISSVIFAPLGTAMASACGARNTFKILGAIFLVVICLGALIMKTCPQGFVPEGYVVPAAQSGKQKVDKTPTEMLKTPIFYVMLIMLTAGGTFGLMIISTAKTIAEKMVQAPTATATLFVSVLCLFNTAGRLIAGTLSDKLGRINTLTTALLIALGGLGLLIGASATTSIALFAVGVILIGICFGTFMGVFPGFTTDQFGTKYNTVNYGIMWIGFSIAGLAGPSILTKTYESTGNYTTAFVIAIIIAVVGLLMSVIYRALQKKNM